MEIGLLCIVAVILISSLPVTDPACDEVFNAATISYYYGIDGGIGGDKVGWTALPSGNGYP